MFLLPLLLTAAISLSCTKGEMSGGQPEEKTNVVATLNKTLILELVNAARQKGCQCGDTYYNSAPPVKWNAQLEHAALAHSADMYKKKYFSHVASDGSNGGVRIEKTGYAWLAYGENIGMGYTTEYQVVEGWLKSPTHCKNIMNKAYTEMGVARVGTYWTQVFATR